MKVALRKVGPALFEAKNERGNTTFVDGPADVGGQDAAFRPMENVLVSLAGCAAVDVLLILQKGRHTVDDLRIEVDGQRKDAVPAVFETIHVHFSAQGSFDLGKLERACDLSMEKYCSVAKMLAPTVTITHSSAIIESDSHAS